MDEPVGRARRDLVAAYERLGDAIRSARSLRGWSQSELARAAHVSRRSVTSAEKGHVPFDGRPAGSVVRIAAALGWSVQKIDQLLDEGALVTDESESRAAHETLDDIIADIRSSQELGRRDREIVISLIEQMRRERREGGE